LTGNPFLGRSGDGKERWIFAVTQQYAGSFNPRLRNRHQLRFATSASLIDNSIIPAMPS